jgi:hypothetical protein
MPLLRRPRAAFLLAAPLAACASGGASANRAPVADPMAVTPTTTRIESMTGAAEVRSFTNPVATNETAVAAPVAKAFEALPVAYEMLGVPVNVAVTDAGTFGAREMRMPRRLGKSPLSQYVSCGYNATGTPNADVYAVTMTVLSRVTPAGGGADGSTLVTQITASARPITTSGAPVQCSSTGRLEGAINEWVVKLSTAR